MKSFGLKVKITPSPSDTQSGWVGYIWQKPGTSARLVKIGGRPVAKVVTVGVRVDVTVFVSSSRVGTSSISDMVWQSPANGNEVV